MSPAIFKNYLEASGYMCETNIMYAVCMLLSFPAELGENGEKSLQHCLKAIILEADVSKSFSTKCFFCGLSGYSSCLLFAIATMVYLLWVSLF